MSTEIVVMRHVTAEMLLLTLHVILVFICYCSSSTDAGQYRQYNNGIFMFDIYDDCILK